jgi:hypothetical protein
MTYILYFQAAKETALEKLEAQCMVRCTRYRYRISTDMFSIGYNERKKEYKEKTTMQISIAVEATEEKAKRKGTV